MTKKKTGFLPLLVGAVAGAAAIFFSDEKNRDQAKKTLAEVKKDPEAFAKKTGARAKVVAKKTAAKAKVAVKKASVKAKAEIAKKRPAGTSRAKNSTAKPKN